MADADCTDLFHTGGMSALPKENDAPDTKRQRLEIGNSGKNVVVDREGETGFSCLQSRTAFREEGEASAGAATKSREQGERRGLPAGERRGLPAGEGERQLAMLLVHDKQEGVLGELEKEDGADPAVGYGASVHLHDDLANGFHSCDSDDDRASHASSSDWTPKPCIGPYTFVQRHLMMGTDPRTILKDLLPESVAPPELDDMTLWQIVINILSDPPKRKKRKDVNTIEDAVKLLQQCKKIMVLTGAGVSVSCGIPDFRSRDGIYARLAVDFTDLPNPQAMFDIEYFRKDPRPFFKFAKEIYPGQFQPSLCHKFIAMLDKEEKLLRNYTQNIDTLEQVAGIKRIMQCHGSFAMASCLICKYKVDCEAVRKDIFNQVVPRCPRCSQDDPHCIMKPDIVFFGENLPEPFHRAMKYDKNEVDLLIVIGSSLKVRPVALIPSSIPPDVPQILINREPLPHLHFDIELLGDCDVIINELCQRLNGRYTQLCTSPLKLLEITEKPPRFNKQLFILPDTFQPISFNIPEDSDIQGKLAQPELSLIVPKNICESAKSNIELSQSCIDGNMDTFRVDNTTESRSIGSQLEHSGSVKETKSSNSEDQEQPGKDTDTDPFRKCLASKFPKEQISTQYLFLAPNRYIFHGAEVFSDSEDMSYSSCGTNSDSESLHSRSLQDPVEEDSDNEEFYNNIKYDTDSDAENRVGLEDEAKTNIVYEHNDDNLGTDSRSVKL
ncbi:NAD-dependent protein deacetylase sirtuin-1 isoform X2 [Ascaphus truei]|uniref:NAD-dependent protein deacetylase sirtuin-1 isoform X2 n=1 Tax=Ascaphus truei TaxID=8439 RepID=UPI003F5ACBD8